MIRFQINEEKGKISFKYGTVEDQLWRGKHRVIEAHVSLDETSTNTHVGSAICHQNDNFCKDTGRKMALTRAIVDLPRHLRRTIWAAYHNRPKKVDPVVRLEKEVAELKQENATLSEHLSSGGVDLGISL